MIDRMPPRIWLRYDLRAPTISVGTERLYAAALEQCRWADTRGFHGVQLSEHHGSDDAYLPSPLVMAGAIGACTRNLRISIAALVLPLHDPLRVAEDVAVADLISGGRIELVIAAGYVESEFEMFGQTLAGRVSRVEDGIAVLEKAWTGEPFSYRGKRVRVLPRPVQRPRPPLILGGSSKPAARRAARIADGFMPALPNLWDTYREEKIKLGEDPGPVGRMGPMFLHVAEDPDEAWALIAPHALHEMNAYGRWMTDAGTAGPYQPIEDADTLRASGMYRVVTPEQCVELARSLGSDGTLLFHPLMGGLSPELGEASLELVVSRVLPKLD